MKWRQAGAVRLAVCYADCRRASRRQRFSSRPPADDRDLFHRMEPLLETLAARRTRIRWMGLTLSELSLAARQLELFDATG